MDTMLQGIPKIDVRRSKVDRTRLVDVSQLDVGFGGFTPMPLNDVVASREQVLESERRIREYRASVERAARLEEARASEVRTLEAKDAQWRYVVIDGAGVRIERCETTLADVAVPASIEGLPVVALAADSCARLSSVERLTCPDTVQSIGGCAFRECKSLRSIAFPRDLAMYSSDWVRGCARLEELKLPGRWATLDARIFDSPNLKTLVVGPGTAEVAPGAFLKSALVKIALDERNPYLSTDGKALYSRDGETLIALAVPVARYEVLRGCKTIAKKGMSNFASLEEVCLPEGLEVLGEFSLSRTSVASFTAPASLRFVREKAFFGCARLVSVALNEGLCAIGANAFTDTAIEALFVPSTVAEMGSPLAAGTGLVYAGAEATFGVAAGSPHFSLGEAGGLYRSDAEGLHLVRMMDPVAASYEVRPSTVSIDAEAFAGHGRLERVTLPEGLRVIGAGAFRDCRRLERVTLPESIERIEAEAFLDSGLVELSIPRNVGHIGRLALVAHGSHHGKTAPTLRSIEVDARNERFFMSSGLLLERLSGDTLRVVLFNDSEEVVRVPEGVVSIAPYALNNARNVRELYLSDRITEVGTRGLAVNCHIDLIHVDLVEPIGGHALIELRFPRIDRSVQQIGLAFSLPDHVNVESLLEHYDNAVIQGCSYDALNDGGIGLYEQATRILDRLRDPIFLNQVNRSLCERILEQNIDEICADVARHDDRRTVDALVDLGFVNEGNVNRIIERVGAVQDAAMTGYLLEVKRQRFEQATFDFDL